VADSVARAKMLAAYASAYPEGSPERTAIDAELEALRRNGVPVPPIAPSPYMGLPPGFFDDHARRAGPGYFEATAEVDDAMKGGIVIPPQSCSTGGGGSAPLCLPGAQREATEPPPPITRRRRFIPSFASPQQLFDFAGAAVKLGSIAWKAVKAARRS